MYFFNSRAVLARKPILQYNSTLKQDLTLLPHRLFVCFPHSFLLCFCGSCVDLADDFSVFDLCISCSISVFHLFGPLFTISLFFSGLFPHPSHPFSYRYFMHSYLCLLSIPFAAYFFFAFPPVNFSPPSWLMNKYTVGSSYMHDISLKTQLHLQ